MGRYLSSDSARRQGPLQTSRRGIRRRSYGSSKVGKGPRGAAQVAGRGVEDRVFLGESRGPAARLVESALVLFWSFEDGTGEDDGGRCLFRRGRLSVWIAKAAAAEASRLAEKHASGMRGQNGRARVSRPSLGQDDDGRRNSSCLEATGSPLIAEFQSRASRRP